MGQAKVRERQIKDMTLPELMEHLEATDRTEAVTAGINEYVVPWLQTNLPGLVDAMVKERIAEFYAFLVSTGRVTPPDDEELEEAQEPSGSVLYTPQGGLVRS